MPKPIRYYITTSGEEPTVRSVTVAQSSPEPKDRVASNGDATAEVKAPARPAPAPTKVVGSLVKGAMRGRPSGS